MSSNVLLTTISNACLLEALDLGCTVEHVRLFHHLSIRLLPHELVEIRGANGSGKSTLIRILAGLKHQTEGRVLATAHAKAYLGHELGMSDALTVAENLAWANSLIADGHSPNRRHAVYQELDLRHLLDTQVGTLSAGQKRRAAFARLVTSRAPVWLLDEPFSTLDDESTSRVRDVLGRHLENGGAAVVATHAVLHLPIKWSIRL